MINDPVVNEAAIKAAKLAMTDMRAAMKFSRAMMPYFLDQAYVIPSPRYPQYVFWWPWVRNYSGEITVGYTANNEFLRWLWYDQTLKKSMGY